MSTVAIFDDAIFDEDIFDTRTKVHFVTINDEGGNVSDLITTKSKFFRVIQEAQGGMFDSAIFDRAIFDTTNIGAVEVFDALTAVRKFFTTITETPIAISDLIATKLGAFRILADTTIISDTLATLSKFFRTILEPPTAAMFDGPLMFDPAIFDTTTGGIRITDSVTAIRGNKITIVEAAIIVSDDLVRKLKAFVGISENTTVSDVLATKLAAFVTLVEITLVSDSLTRKLKAFRILADTTIISDLIASVKGANRSIVETTISISDVLTTLAKKFRIIVQNTTVSDILTAFKVVGRRSKQAFAWINKKSAKAFIFKRKTNADANKRGTSAKV